MKHTLHFLKQVRTPRNEIGAIAPTSKWAALALAEECARHHGPKKVLELGAGTGAITTYILPSIGPRDSLTLCEIHPGMVGFLRHRIQTEAAFRRLGNRIHLEPVSATELRGEGEYDYVICSIPFSVIPPEVVQAIFERVKVLLKPGGILSYIEYAWLRGIRSRVAGPIFKKFKATDKILEHYIRNYQVSKRTVFRNLPPAWIRHLRFQDGPADRAVNLTPLEQRHRMPLVGRWGVARDAVNASWGLLGLAGVLTAVPHHAELCGIPMLGAGLISLFLRDPYRKVSLDTGLAYAACDGRVIHVEEVTDARLGPGKWVRVATFLGVNDIHINRAPIAGKIVDRFHRKGGYAVANRRKAERNHSVFTVIEGIHGRCGVAQRVGFLARRIVSWYRVGELVAQGERYGLIRFGSRTDVYLPADRVEILVKPRQKVIGGITPLARFVCAEPR